MDVVASIGFGVEIDTQKNPNSDFVKYAKKYFEMPSSPILALISKFIWVNMSLWLNCVSFDLQIAL